MAARRGKLKASLAGKSQTNAELNALQPRWHTVEKLVGRKALGQTSSLADTREDGEDGAPAEDVLLQGEVFRALQFPTYDLCVKEGDIEGPLKDHFNGVRTTARGFRSGQCKARAPQGRHPSSGALYQQALA